MTTPLKKIVIVGGGAGGLELATQLGKKLGRGKKAKITLVDRNHSHLWKPLLHEVATGSLDEGVDALSYLAHARTITSSSSWVRWWISIVKTKPSRWLSCVMIKASCWFLSASWPTTRW
ncbi:NADH dehydrogenase [Enterobacter hormaechei]|nr:NADH dehydrogenase [Enterobacter hormaechei]